MGPRVQVVSVAATILSAPAAPGPSELVGRTTRDERPRRKGRDVVDAFKQRCIKFIRRAEDGSLKLRGELKSPSTYEINA